jgi:DNA-directed RNA polymerase specialized sigma24 family protein
MVARGHDPFVWLLPDLAADGPAYQDYADRLTGNLKRYFAGNGCPDAADLASESILRLVSRLASDTPPECASETEKRQYLFGIAKNVLRESRRSQQTREVPYETHGCPEFSLPPIDMIAAECLALLRAAVRENLAQMSPVDRDILNRNELNPEYRPRLRDLAKTERATDAAMRQRAHRARIRFRRLLVSSDRIKDLLRCLGIERVNV